MKYLSLHLWVKLGNSSIVGGAAGNYDSFNLIVDNCIYVVHIKNLFVEFLLSRWEIFAVSLQVLKGNLSSVLMAVKRILLCKDLCVLDHGPLLLDDLLGAETMNSLKSRNFFKSSFGVNVKVHISHQKKFCKAMFIHFRFIVSQSL